MKKEEFLNFAEITEKQFLGIDTVGGYLDLRSLTSIPEGFNPTVGGYLDLSSLTSIPEGFNPTVGGSLYLSSLTSIPEGFNPTVGGSLYLSSLTSIPEGFNPTVGGYLDLRSLTSIPEGFNPTVGGYLDLRSLTSIPEGFNPTVGGYLDLSSLTSIPEGFNPTVGGSLDLSSLTSIPEGFNPTVGGYLDLSSLTSIPEGFNPTVGGYLDLSSLTSIPEGFNKHDFQNQTINSLSWENGKYILVDGIFTEVVHTKGNIIKAKKLYSNHEIYIVSDGKNNYAHGETIKEANQDLLFKITKRSKEDYKEYTLDTVLDFTEAVVCYRVVTGACSFGTNDFLKHRLEDKKDAYSIREMIELTKNEYRGDYFKVFFNN